MNRLLCISDIHIDDYKDYNYEHQDRLNYYISYAEEVCKVAKEHNVEYLGILGDLINIPLPAPYILHITKKVLEIFSKNFTKIYYILGQHDLTSKSNDNHWKDSLVHLLVPSNFEYMDGKVIKLGNTTIAFRDFYYGGPDTEFITDKVDFYLGHLTISTLFGQDIDNTKFTHAICGDIHYAINIDNLHSVGMSLQRHFSDSEDMNCVLIDLNTKEWTRILIDENHDKFMRLRITKDIELEGFSAELNSLGHPKYYYRYRDSRNNDNPYESSTNESALESLNSDSSINQVVEAYCKSHNLLSIHDEVLDRFDDPGVPSLDFEIIELELQNFKSIDYLKLDFTKLKGCVGIYGENGSGKSSIIYGLYYGLVPGNEFLDYQKHGTDYCKIQLTIKYSNRIYKIYKDSEEHNFCIDGEWQNLKKRDNNAAIYEHLPFINYIDSFFFSDETVSIMSSYSTDRRIDLLSFYFRLDIIDLYSKIAEQLKTEESDRYYKIEGEINALESDWNARQLTINKIEVADYDESKVVELEDIINKARLIEAKLANLPNKSKLKDELLLTEKKLKEITTEIDEIELRINRIKDKYGDKLSNVGSIIDNSTNKEELRKLDKEVAFLESDINNKTELLNNSSFATCTNCNALITVSQGNVIDKSLVKSIIDKNKDELSLIKSKIDKLVTEIKDIDSNNELIKELNQANENIKNLQLSLVTNNKLKDEYLKSKIDINDKIEFIESNEVPDVSNEVKLLEQIKTNIALHNEKERLQLLLDNDKSNSNIKELYNKLELSNTKWYQYDAYCNLLSNKGEIRKVILDNIIKTFNSDNYKYELYEATYRNKEYYDIRIKYQATKDSPVLNYWECSRGQKTLCDIHFISNLLTRGGLLVLDEYLKYLSVSNQVIATEMISNMKPKLKIITNQLDLMYMNHNINCSYDGKSTTISTR